MFHDFTFGSLRYESWSYTSRLNSSIKNAKKKINRFRAVMIKLNAVMNDRYANY